MEGFFRTVVDGQTNLWTPSWAKDLHVRLMVCAHMKQEGHRPVAATVGSRMDVQVAEFMHSWLHCMNSNAGEMVLCPFGETAHGARPGEVQCFDYLCR